MLPDFAAEGKYHPIEVEDDVTAYMEWENGASGGVHCINRRGTSVNRLEISLDNALLVCDKVPASCMNLTSRK